LWIFIDKDGAMFLAMVFGWAGWIVCFGKELKQGHW